MNKKSLRNFYRQQRLHLTDFQVTEASILLKNNLLTNKKIQQAKNIGLYSAYKNEIDLTLFFQHCLTNNKNCYFPICKNNNLLFAQATSNTKWDYNNFKILEPTNHSTISINHLDCVILPALAIDKNYTRLGSGYGFYDKAMANSAVYKIGVIYQFQFCDNLPNNLWDIPLDCIYVI